ncbi:hypothetical protein PAMP_015564 [Pampus punctatissimus]
MFHGVVRFDLEKCFHTESDVLVLSAALQGLKGLITGYAVSYRFYITLLVISTALLLTGTEQALWKPFHHSSACPEAACCRSTALAFGELPSSSTGAPRPRGALKRNQTLLITDVAVRWNSVYEMQQPANCAALLSPEVAADLEKRCQNAPLPPPEPEHYPSTIHTPKKRKYFCFANDIFRDDSSVLPDDTSALEDITGRVTLGDELASMHELSYAFSILRT